MYKLAPTDLTFMLSDCECCFTRKVRDGVARPFMPFPSVFKSIDKCMRVAYEGVRTEDLGLPLKPGVIRTKEERVKQEFTHNGHTYLLSGKLDALIHYDDGSIGIVDFKTSDPKDDHKDLYWRQLSAYSLGFDNVSSLGLIVVSPDNMKVYGSQAALMMATKYVDLPIDPIKWSMLMDRVDGLLSVAESINVNCLYCRAYGYEKLFKRFE